MQASILRRAGPLPALLAVLPGPASAHGFGQVYTLPVPVWLYQYAGAAALLLSFLVIGWFVGQHSVDRNRLRIELGGTRCGRLLLHPLLRGLLRVTGVAVLALTIATGLFGSQDSYANLSMTQFWIVFVLGYAYITGLVGSTWGVMNPWRSLCAAGEWLRPGLFGGRLRWPRRLEYWPALLLYIAFIAFELFGNSRPHSLALVLSGYTLLNLAAAHIFGAQVWFRQGEFFGVMFGLLGRMAPLTTDSDPGGRRQLILRQPFAGLLGGATPPMGLLLFVLFMLSSTAFDGIKSTVPWVSLYWVQLAGWLDPWISIDGVRNFSLLRSVWPWWQGAALLLSPLFYLAVYWLFMWLTRLVTASELSTRELALRFALTLLPIAFAYHLTHYFTLLLSQGPRLLALLSDPFGWGWNLFGTAKQRYLLLPQAGTIWHLQVWMIVAGHVVSVYLAHLQALAIFPERRRAMLSQLPMLALMVALTVFGLWILSLPISSGR